MSHFSEEQMTPSEIMQGARKVDKRIGYSDAVLDLIDLVTKMGLDNETVMNIQSEMILKMGVYQRPTDSNLYDKL